MANTSHQFSNLGRPVRVLVTAGPTHEPIDAVRYIANRSSGRMGLALVEAALQRGFPTTLALGPTSLLPPVNSHLRLVRFQTTAQLEQLLHELWPSHDVLFMAAAVADYRLSQEDVSIESGASPSSGDGPIKLPRADGGIRLNLEATPDLLSGLAARTRPDQTVIGFALESAPRLIESAKHKLTQKRVSAIVANPLETMDSPEVTATVLVRGGETLRPPPRMPKRDFANWLFDSLPRIQGLAAQSG